MGVYTFEGVICFTSVRQVGVKGVMIYWVLIRPPCERSVVCPHRTHVSHLAERMMTRASSSLASSSSAVKLVSWLNWRTFSACDWGTESVKQVYLPTTSEPRPLNHFCLICLLLIFFFFFLSWKKGGREKRDRVPRESVQRKTKTKENEKKTNKSLEGGERKNLQFISCLHANWRLSRLQRRTCKLEAGNQNKTDAIGKENQVKGWWERRKWGDCISPN